MNLYNFHNLPSQKIREKKYYKFQWHSLLTALHKKICTGAPPHNVFFGFGFCALLERRVDEIKNSKSKIIL